jgi:small conductance mechanosensitive channel
MEDIINKLKSYTSDAIINIIFRVFAGLLVLIVGLAIVNRLIKLMAKSRLLTKMDSSNAAFARTLLSITLKALVILTVASIIGVPMASILAIVGSVGLAIGLSLQGSLSNFAGGVLIVSLKPFKLGDIITPEKGEMGTVTDIGIFYTKIQTFDNREVMLPNGSLLNQTIVNNSSFATRRADLDFTVAYDSDISTVNRLLTETAEAHPLVLKDPPIFARLTAMEDSAMKFTLRVWCKTEDHFNILLDLRENVKDTFDKNGIAIPFPQLDVHNVIDKQ